MNYIHTLMLQLYFKKSRIHSYPSGQEQCWRRSLGLLGSSCMLKKLKNAKKVNSRKSVRWSAVPVPCLSRLCFKLKGKEGSGPIGVDDLCFHTYGGFSPPPSSPPPSPPPSLPPQIPVLRPKFQSQGQNPSLEAQIPALRPKS